MVLLKTLNKRGQLMSVATKIGIQISAKLGGEIWSVSIPVNKQKFFLKFLSFVFLFKVKKFNDYWY
jgi:hypothetical protein